eukprot:scaffold227487_cov36-Tisochrysis_lutea.AAC.1
MAAYSVRVRAELRSGRFLDLVDLGFTRRMHAPNGAKQRCVGVGPLTPHCYTEHIDFVRASFV